MADDSETPEAVSEEKAAPAAGIEALIERWWADHFPGSAVARDTAAWNVAHDAKEALKRLLQGSN